MNIADRVIAAAFPAWGLRRLRARAALTVLRDYEGAQVGRRTANWKATSSSANSELAPALVRLRNRARDLVRNNPYAARAIAGLRSKGVGTGIVARPEKTVRKAWKEFVENCDFDAHFDLYGLQNQWAGAAFESGEVIIRRVRTRDGVGIRLQTLEADYIDTFKWGPLEGGNQVIAGVEVDRQGRKVALWLYEQHPGEVNFLPKNFASGRVPVEDLIHFGEKLRPGQLRYAPRLAVSMMKLRDLDEFEEAELIRKKMEACFVAFVTGGDAQGTLGESAVNSETGKRQETLAPGMIYYPREGESVTFGSPTGTTEAVFSKRHLHAIAVGTGITYELLTGDLSQVNFSSIRAGAQDFRALIDEWRWIHFVPVACQRVYRWFEEAAFTAGRLRSTGYDVIWTPPRWPYVNPVDDIKADKEEILGGLSSLSAKLRERGEDPQDVFAEIDAERKDLKAKEIVVDTDAAVAAKAAAPAPATANPDDADAGKNKDDEDKRANDARLLTAVERQGELFAMIAAREPVAPAVNVTSIGKETVDVMAHAAGELIETVRQQKEAVAQMAAIVETANSDRRDTAQALERVADGLQATGEAIRSNAAEQARQAAELGAGLRETQGATLQGFERVVAEIGKPSKPIFDENGNVKGVKKVDALD